MKQIIPKWALRETTVTHYGVIDKDYSGYDLLKNGVPICKFGHDSLIELKEFFAKLEIK